MTALVSADSADRFRYLTGPYVHELHVHCYRMLGSVDDADDLLQETLVAAWQGLDDFEGRSSLRTWLYRIATNRCLNAIRDGKRRPPVAPVPPFEPPPPTSEHPATWVQPYPYVEDPAETHIQREHIELAFITALQTLPPRQTAAVVLVDVLGFSLAEAADLLGVSSVAAKGLLQRSRKALSVRDEQHSLPTRAEERRLAELFAVAYASDDIDGVLDLLTDTAWLAMPPAPHMYRGREAIGTFLEASIAWRRGSRQLALSPVECNAAPAFAVRMSGSRGYLPAGIVVLEATAEGISGITRFLSAPPVS